MTNFRGVSSALAPLLLTALLAAPSTVLGDTYYRWTDGSGDTVMSDRPPEDPAVPYETVTIRETSLRPSRATPAPAAGADAEATPEGAGGAAQLDRYEVTQSAPAVKPDPAACEQARRNLEVLDSKPRIRVYDDEGELRYLSASEVAAEREKMLLAIDLHCGG